MNGCAEYGPPEQREQDPIDQIVHGPRTNGRAVDVTPRQEADDHYDPEE